MPDAPQHHEHVAPERATPHDEHAGLPHARGNHEHVAPERTTPQGTQAQGVEHGHESVDVNFRSLAIWFTGLAVGLAVTFLIVSAAYGVWSAWDVRSQTLPSDVFARQQTPPLPRLLPNPIDNPGRPLPEPPVIMQAWRQQQQALAQQYGLEGPDGMPTLPKDIETAVLSSARASAGRAGRPDALQLKMPSGSSGGTAEENRLR
jgi:hypothetical protein